jgi:hypothetical protein
MSDTLLIATGFQLVVAVLYIVVGRLILARRVPGEAQLASNFFAIWWFALAGGSLIGVARKTFHITGILDLPMVVTMSYIELFFICFALLGLLYYLVFLYTGKRNAIYPMAGAYLLYYASLFYFITSHRPIGFEVGDWSIGIEYEIPPAESLITVILLLLLLIPQILAAFAYFLLFFRVEDRAQKYRIAMVSGAIVVWFGSALVGAFTPLNDLAAWPIVSRVIGLAAALAVLFAFSPPKWVQRRFEIEPIDSGEHVKEVRPNA